MVVFAHGYDVTPETYAALLDTWVRQGFVVVAPFFPDENAAEVDLQHGANTEGDLANEPGDLAFVTRAVLTASANESSNCRIVRGLVDPTAIALAGHSDGGDAVGMLAYDHGDDPQGVNFASLRTGIDYRAVIIMSGAEDTSQSYATEASRPDLLVIQSLDDQCNAMHFGVQIYDAIRQPNKWFLELQTAHHLPPFDDADPSAFGTVATTTVQFLQISLERATPTISLLALGNERPTIARMFFGEQGSLMNNVTPVKEVCGPN
jgi:poly(3-hydroxybutyrate) depolymerase